MNLSEWYWWYLWPKMAFKLSQEFPTAFLDITKLSKTAAQYTSIPHSSQLRSCCCRFADRVPLIAQSSFAARVVVFDELAYCNITLLNHFTNNYNIEFRCTKSTRRCWASLWLLFNRLRSIPPDFYWRHVLSVHQYFSCPFSLSSIHHKCGRYKLGPQRMCWKAVCILKSIDLWIRSVSCVLLTAPPPPPPASAPPPPLPATPPPHPPTQSFSQSPWSTLLEWAKFWTCRFLILCSLWRRIVFISSPCHCWQIKRTYKGWMLCGYVQPRVNRRSSEIQGTALGKCLQAWPVYIQVPACGCSAE